MRAFRGQFKSFKVVLKPFADSLTMPGKAWTKMLSNWREKAGEYFRDGLSISDISNLLSISRQSVAAHIRSLPDYDEIMERKRLLQEEKRRAYKREKQSAYRARESYAMRVTGETLRREHELAVIELSRERYH